jgi:hypothetical protein
VDNEKWKRSESQRRIKREGKIEIYRIREEESFAAFLFRTDYEAILVNFGMSESILTKPQAHRIPEFWYLVINNF